MTRLRHRLGRETGYTLVEMLIGTTLFAVLGALTLSTVLSARDAADNSRLANDLNEEARVALNRMARELRQAEEIREVEDASGNPVTATAPDAARSVTFSVDFNGNGTIDSSSADPELLTYTWDGNRLLLSATNSSGLAVVQPVLAGNVTDFSLQFRSSRWQYDCNGDGSTTWPELDAHSACAPASAGVGDNSGSLTAAELRHLDSVVVNVTVLDGAKRQEYRTQIDLRNAR